jgi:RimJ/RimL family protein N-acetyltransferase
VPDGEAAHRRFVENMIAEHAAGHRLGFATLRIADRRPENDRPENLRPENDRPENDRPENDRPENDQVVGTTSYLDPQRWPGGDGRLDSIEIGATWIGASAQRTVVNSEAKLLMLAHAFDVMDVHRVVLNTDARNERSRAAIARIGATFEGVLHGFRYGVEGTPRDTATFAIRASEWPDVRARLEARVNATQ